MTAIMICVDGEVREMTPEERTEHETVQGRIQAEIQARRHLVPKLMVVDRLIAAGKLEQALGALNADAVAKARWDAAIEIYSDDPTATGLLSVIGADPAVILAPV